MPSLFIGKRAIELDSVDSTNTYAKELLKKERPVEGTLIFAHEQKRGRGQRNNGWESEMDRNLTVSIILYPEFLQASKQFYLSMAIALGVKDFCESILNEEIKIKWPNDIYCHDKKIGGLLLENTISNTSISTSVVGIGINVNQVKFSSSIPNPGSFALISGKNYVLETLIERVCGFIEKYYLQLRQRHFNFLEKAYVESLYRYQQTYQFKKGEQVFRGEINGITKEGKLVIHSAGKEQRFAFKEVEYVI